MTDISKCDGARGAQVCPRRETCYRYVAPAGAWQPWIPPPLKADGTCDYYDEIDQSSKRRKLSK